MKQPKQCGDCFALLAMTKQGLDCGRSKIAQTERVRYDEHGRERHRGRGEDGVQQPPHEWIQYPRRNWNAQDVVEKRPEEISLDRTERSLGQSDRSHDAA